MKESGRKEAGMSARAIVLVVLTLAACASAPAPKMPDESHRVPVNRVVPPELEEAGKVAEEKQPPRVRGKVVAGVEWW